MSRTSLRLDDELEQAAREKCRRLDLNLSQVVRQLLRQWIAEDELLGRLLDGQLRDKNDETQTLSHDKAE